MTIAESFYLYKQQKLAVGMSRDTVDRVITNASMMCADMEIKRISNITTDKILEWGGMKLCGGVKSSTLSTYYNSIRAYVKFLESNRIAMAVSPGDIRCTAHYGTRRALRPRDIRKIMACAGPQTHVLINFMYMTGLRIAEAVSITPEHLEDGTTLYICSKGGKDWPVFIDADMLSKLRLLAIAHGGTVFVDRAGVRLTRKKAYYYIKKAMIEAGYGYASPHTLRHTFATELLRKGASLSHTSRLMRHSSVAVTQVYTHLLTDDIQKAHKLLTPVG